MNNAWTKAIAIWLQAITYHIWTYAQVALPVGQAYWWLTWWGFWNFIKYEVFQPVPGRVSLYFIRLLAHTFPQHRVFADVW